MDLTKNFPRSPYDQLAGMVMLPRTIDKARAYTAGTLGEYRYECPLDQEVFEFLGIDGKTLTDKAAMLDDAPLEQWLRKEYLSKKSAADIEEFNRSFIADMKPEPGSDSEKRFLETRNRLDPARTDITTWLDLLDLEEGRPVPHRAGV
jgi:hypothetical protein